MYVPLTFLVSSVFNYTYPFSFKHKYFSVLILWTSFRCVAMQRLDNHVPSLQLSVPSSLTTVTAHAVVVWITTEVRLRDIKTYSATVNIIALFQLCQSAAWCWAWLVIAVLVVKRFVSWAAGFGCLPFMIKAHHWSYLASTSARPWALAPLCREPLWLTRVVATRCDTYWLRGSGTRLVWKLLEFVSDHIRTENCSDLCSFSTVDRTLAPLWCHPLCLTFPIVTWSGGSEFVSLGTVIWCKSITSLSATEHDSTLLPFATRNWTLWPFVACKPFSFAGPCKARFRHRWLGTLRTQPFIDVSIINIHTLHNSLFMSFLASHRTLAPFTYCPVCWRRTLSCIAAAASGRSSPLATVADWQHPLLPASIVIDKLFTQKASDL